MFLYVLHVFHVPCNSENQISIIACVNGQYIFFLILNLENWSAIQLTVRSALSVLILFVLFFGGFFLATWGQQSTF